MRSKVFGEADPSSATAKEQNRKIRLNFLLEESMPGLQYSSFVTTIEADE